MKQRIRTLNEAGLRHFRSWLMGGGAGEPPVSCLLDASTAEILPSAGDVEQLDFASRYELAVHIHQALQDCDFNRISYEAGLWAWLSLFYIDLLCPVDRHGKRTVLEIPRYLLTPEYRNYYRHVIREAVMLVRRDGEYAQALLTSRAGRFRISRLFEEIASRRDLISNPGIVELVWRLYFNPKRETVRAGVAGEGRSGGVRRFALVLQQLSLNYDLPALNARQIADLLPREFEPWIRRANWAAVEPLGRSCGPAPRIQFDNIAIGSQWRRTQLAELWGYGDMRALRKPILAPRGHDLLIAFITGDEPTDQSERPAPERTLRWRLVTPRATVRRLARTQKDERSVHVFWRAQAGAAFAYKGKARVVALTPATEHAHDIELLLAAAAPMADSGT